MRLTFALTVCTSEGLKRRISGIPKFGSPAWPRSGPGDGGRREGGARGERQRGGRVGHGGRVAVRLAGSLSEGCTIENRTTIEMLRPRSTIKKAFVVDTLLDQEASTKELYNLAVRAPLRSAIASGRSACVLALLLMRTSFVSLSLSLSAHHTHAPQIAGCVRLRRAYDTTRADDPGGLGRRRGL